MQMSYKCPDESKFSFRCHRLRNSPEVLKTVNAGVVAIAPSRLDGITPDNLKSSELEAVFGVTDLRPNNTAEDVRLAAASRARTSSPQELQIKIRFTSVVPANRQFM